MYYIFVVFVQDSNFAGIRVGLTDEELKLCISETTLSGGKIMRQSFRPKIAGRGIEQNAMDFFQMKKKGKKLLPKRPTDLNLWTDLVYELIFSIHNYLYQLQLGNFSNFYINFF